MAVRISLAVASLLVLLILLFSSSSSSSSSAVGSGVVQAQQQGDQSERPSIASSPPFLGEWGCGFIILSSAAAAFAFAMYYWRVTAEIQIDPARVTQRNQYLTDEVLQMIYTIAQRVSDGATAFLMAEYRVLAIFLGAFGTGLFFLLGISLSSPATPDATAQPGQSSSGITQGHAAKPTDTPWMVAFFSVFSFFVGAGASIVSGWIGMRIAVFTNSRTAIMATEGLSKGNPALSYTLGFQTAFRGGITMGFALTSLGIFFLYFTVKIGQMFFFTTPDRTHELYEAVAAFGLGGSAVACFGRVGGGIFTKAADVGADLVGKIEKNLPEDDARNPGVIADCIGDNVGDIAGMGADLFGSFGEAACAAMVISAGSVELSSSFASMAYPLLVTGAGTLVCMAVAHLGAQNSGVRCAADVEPALKKQLLYSTIGSTVAIFFVTMLALPDAFVVSGVATTKWSALICVLAGLWSGLVIGYYTEYYTSSAHKPVQEVAESCNTGAATNIIYGLSLGFKSVLPPTITMAITVYLSDRLCGVFGYALAAIGILSTMATALTIDAYGPISDNAGGFAEMASMGEEVREVTDALDAAGNTTAAVGKGFAIGSAAFVALALYGAFVARINIGVVNMLDHRVFPGILVGAMLPYWFSAMTMKSVGIAAMAMVDEIRRQFADERIANGTKEPDYDRCVAIATQGALQEMVAPAVLVLASPVACALLFGKYTLAGMIPGALVSGVHLAISSSNTGGAWDNAKKYIEAGGLASTNGKGKGTPQHAAAVVGDTVGDPLKDTSGPALNILIKLIAILSLVLVPVVTSKFGGFLLAAIE